MSHRLNTILILVFWTGSVTWFLQSEIVRARHQTAPLKNIDVLPTVASTEVAKWHISLDELPIGSAVTTITRDPSGEGRMTTSVHFPDLSLDRMLEDLTQSMRLLRLFRNDKSEQFGSVVLFIHSELVFDAFGDLDRFSSRVSVDELEDFIQLRGVFHGEELHLKAFTSPSGNDSELQLIYDAKMKIPRDTLVADTFSPHGRLARLRLGQTWTYRRYQPLRPTHPVETMRARVERRESINLNGISRTAFVITITHDQPRLLSSAREPVGTVWMLPDGTVVRQETEIGKRKLVFERENFE